MGGSIYSSPTSSLTVSLPPTVGGDCISTDCTPPGGYRRPYCHCGSTHSCAVCLLRSAPPSSSTPFAGDFYWKSWSCSPESRIMAITEEERREIFSLACSPKPLRYGCLTRSQCTLVKLLDKPMYPRTMLLWKTVVACFTWDKDMARHFRLDLITGKGSSFVIEAVGQRVKV